MFEPSRISLLAFACLLACTGMPSSPASAASPGLPGRVSAAGPMPGIAVATYYERRALEPAFAAAYRRFPTIPAGTLEAIAHARSRWRNLQPDPADTQHGPPVYGPMGLYAGLGGFEDQVGMAAAALGVPARRVMREPAVNVLAAAWLLDRALRAQPAGVAATVEIERLAPALMASAGFRGEGEVQAYARASHAFDVLRALDTGVNDGGVRVPERAIRWERAFAPTTLIALRAPMVRLDVSRDRIETADYAIDLRDETLKPKAAAREAGGTANTAQTQVGIQSTDYGPALWVASPYNSARSAAISAVTLHTMQGYYAGSISWFQNNPYSVSAHYLIRSSDGQITQMVRDSRAAHHVGTHNGYTIGIEHEGFIAESSWYTTAMYNASAALTRHLCATYAIDCRTAYNGDAHSGLVLLSTAVKIKGHQHFSSQTHTDPGIHFDWRRYYALLNPGGGGGSTALDDFEAGLGHFDTSPTYSGSTVGIATTSSAARVCDTGSKQGSCRLRLSLVDNTASTAGWAVRLLSASGTPAANVKLTKAGGHLGFWVYPAATGVSVAVSVDDSDGTERSVAKALPANVWTWVEWRLDDGAQWDAWAGGDGIITSTTAATLDAIWFYRADAAGATVAVAVDDVRLTIQ